MILHELDVVPHAAGNPVAAEPPSSGIVRENYRPTSQYVVARSQMLADELLLRSSICTKQCGGVGERRILGKARQYVQLRGLSVQGHMLECAKVILRNYKAQDSSQIGRAS